MDLLAKPVKHSTPAVDNGRQATHLTVLSLVMLHGRPVEDSCSWGASTQTYPIALTPLLCYCQGEATNRDLSISSGWITQQVFTDEMWNLIQIPLKES